MEDNNNQTRRSKELRTLKFNLHNVLRAVPVAFGMCLVSAFMLESPFGRRIFAVIIGYLSYKLAEVIWPIHEPPTRNADEMYKTVEEDLLEMSPSRMREFTEKVPAISKIQRSAYMLGFNDALFVSMHSSKKQIVKAAKEIMNSK